jgi:DNA repair photolyase
MLKKSAGNMYPWVDFTHTHLGGECSHRCSYCYVENPRWGRPSRYQGPVHLIGSEFKVKYDRDTLMKVGGKYPGVIFEEHCNDMFAEDVSYLDIVKILAHCREYQDNEYVFQSKNPRRMLVVDPEKWPNRCIFGTTIETNRLMGDISKAPPTFDRYLSMKAMKQQGRRLFVTIEPVLDFDVEILAGWIADLQPQFLNLGADSKDHKLPEPTADKVFAFAEKLLEYGIELRQKHNLNRLVGGSSLGTLAAKYEDKLRARKS